MPCQFGKQTALPFNNSVYHTLSSFNLIYSDVWGPSPISTPGGSRYFVIFMDDFSQYTWIYLFKNHSELYQIYRDFTKMIETHSFLNLSKFSDLIMPKNIKPMNLPLFYINLVLFLIPLVQALLSKMAGLSVNFVIFLMLFVLLLLPLLRLLSFVLLLLFTPSISVLLPLFIIKLLMICCLFLLPCMTYLESLDVSVLFFFKIMKETNFSLILICVVFLGMELVKKVIGVMIPLENVF